MNNLLSRVALASMLMGASVMAMAATVAPEAQSFHPFPG